MGRASIDTGEIYTTANPFVRWLGGRLTRRIGNILNSVGAGLLLGLDLGCGEGHMQAELRSKKVLGKTVVADIDFQKLKTAKYRFQLTDTVGADCTRLGFRSASFDFVMMLEVLEHLESVEAAILEVKRVTRSEGLLIVSVPHEPFFHWGNLLRGKHLARGGRTPSHLHFWSRAQFKQLLQEFVQIEKEFVWSTFPWLLFLCRLHP